MLYIISIFLNSKVSTEHNIPPVASLELELLELPNPEVFPVTVASDPDGVASFSTPSVIYTTTVVISVTSSVTTIAFVNVVGPTTTVSPSKPLPKP